MDIARTANVDLNDIDGMYEQERHLREKRTDPPALSSNPKGKNLMHVTRDCREDRPHVSLHPNPVRLLSDPQAILIRAARKRKPLGRDAYRAVTCVVDPRAQMN